MIEILACRGLISVTIAFRQTEVTENAYRCYELDAG